jgi:hypothetical protein
MTTEIEPLRHSLFPKKVKGVLERIPPFAKGSCEKSVHGSRASPRTDEAYEKFEYLAVRPFDRLRASSEHVEGQRLIFSQLRGIKGDLGVTFSRCQMLYFLNEH